jgi:hypothetical protein
LLASLRQRVKPRRSSQSDKIFFTIHSIPHRVRFA